jgi:hypothetical protein
LIDSYITPTFPFPASRLDVGLRFMGNSIAALCVGACLTVVPASLEGQGDTPYPAVAGPLSGTQVQNAPFSATAVLTVRGHLKNVPVAKDPTRIWDTYTTRFQRDSAGRVRADYDVPETSPLAPKGARRQVYQVLTDPAEGLVYLVDPKREAIWYVGKSTAFDADVALEIPVAVGPLDSGFMILHMPRAARKEADTDSLGSRHFEGLRAVGRLVTNSLHKSMDEQWASPELRLILYSRHTLPNRGVELEYRLKNVNRAEPPPAVFELPAGYARQDRPVTGR